MNPLVLVHGFMGGGAQWTGQVAALGDCRQIIPVDLPGFGENSSAEAPASIAGFARAVLDHLAGRGIERFDLLGHSMGGMIVQEMAAIAPDRLDRLVLYGTGASGNLQGRFETFEESKRRAISDGAIATAKRISATWFLNFERDPAYPVCAAIAQRSSMQAICAGLDAMEVWSRVENLSQISSPTLVLWGDQDRTYSWTQTEELWSSIPNARLAVVPGCAHAVHLEKPDIFNALIADFLTR